MDGSPLRVALDLVQRRLHERILALGALGPLVVGDITRVFLEFAAVQTRDELWSLEFAFDEDDSRVARLEARFGNGILAERLGMTLSGYEVRILLPKVLPKFAHEPSASTYLQSMRSGTHDLVIRFVRALDEMSGYRYIEQLAAESVETELL
jgi:hypothetical protein